MVLHDFNTKSGPHTTAVLSLTNVRNGELKKNLAASGFSGEITSHSHSRVALIIEILSSPKVFSEQSKILDQVTAEFESFNGINFPTLR